MTKEIKDYEGISPTAWLTAEARTYSDIPYSVEIFDAMRKVYTPPSSELIKSPSHYAGHCRCEARFKIISNILLENKSKQVLEIAAGFSPRGLSMTEDASVTYVETDLPRIVDKNRAAIALIKRKMPKNLYLEVVNALNLADLKSAAMHFDKTKPIAVINEGLLVYFTRGEKEKFARNIATLLKDFGGIWITSDIDIQSLPNKAEALDSIGMQIKKITGISMAENGFESLDAAKRFFGNLGFEVEVHPFMEIKDRLVSAARLSVSESDLEKNLKISYVFAMRLKR